MVRGAGREAYRGAREAGPAGLGSCGGWELQGQQKVHDGGVTVSAKWPEERNRSGRPRTFVLDLWHHGTYRAPLGRTPGGTRC